jgi:heavy metal efflux system protein
LFFSILILVARNEDANLLSVGAVDFGIIVDAAVILVENIYRNFQASPEVKSRLLDNLAEERWGADPTRSVAVATTEPGRRARPFDINFAPAVSFPRTSPARTAPRSRTSACGPRYHLKPS